MTGKSSLAVQFVDGHFVDSYYPTIENTFSKTIRYKGQDYLTEILDTAGQDEYSILNSKHFIGIHGYMLVYSVSSLASFEMVQVIRDKILNHLVRPPLATSAAVLPVRSANHSMSPIGDRIGADRHSGQQERPASGATPSEPRGGPQAVREAQVRIHRGQRGV